jgi:hypothetical protein
MPVNWSVDAANKVVTIRYVDPYTEDEWREAVAAALRDEAYQHGFDFLIDRRFAQAPSEAFARAVAVFISAHIGEFGPARVAIVVSSEAGYGMGRIQQVLNETAGLESRAFTSQDAAADWLRADA